jgi:hypothetical protein
MTVQTQGFTAHGLGASPAQQGPFGPGFSPPIGAEQLFGVPQQYGGQSPYGMQSPYGYQQWPQANSPYGPQTASGGAQQVIQQLAHLIATAQQVIVPQAVGLAVQQVCQQLPQLIAQLAMQQFPGQQPSGQQFAGQPAGPWGQQSWAPQPMASVFGQAGRPYSFLS